MPGDYDWTVKLDVSVAVVPERLRAAWNQMIETKTAEHLILWPCKR